jgi:hypothetical protein
LSSRKTAQSQDESWQYHQGPEGDQNYDWIRWADSKNRPRRTRILAQQEGVVVGDDDFGLSELILQLGRHNVALAIVVIGIVR